MASAIIQMAVINHKGLVRGNNEDNFYLDGTYMQRRKMDDGAYITGNCKNERQLYAVCDGMGGTDCGEDASFCAVSELAARKADYRELADENTLTDTLQAISDKVFDDAAAKGQKSGTTIAMVMIDGNTIHISNVGDSRIYRMQKEKLEQVSVDHSKVQRMVAMGMLTPQQARTDPGRHIISQYLGMPRQVQVSPHFDMGVKLHKGDMYLLCSDGLTDMVEDAQIEAILKDTKETGEAVQKLVRIALKNGGRDNVTVMLLKVLEVVDASGKAVMPGRDYLLGFMTAVQALVGCGALATAADLLFYLASRR